MRIPTPCYLAQDGLEAMPQRVNRHALPRAVAVVEERFPSPQVSIPLSTEAKWCLNRCYFLHYKHKDKENHNLTKYISFVLS